MLASEQTTAHELLRERIEIQDELVSRCGKPKLELEPAEDHSELKGQLKDRTAIVEQFLAVHVERESVPPPAMWTADANCDQSEVPDISDLVYLVDYMFGGGPWCGCQPW